MLVSVMLTLAFLQNVGLPETVVIVIVAILIFGRNLPQVAARAAVQAQRLRKSVADLRRESGIDAEIRAARRELEQSVPRLSDFEARPAGTKVAPPAEPVREDRKPSSVEPEGSLARGSTKAPSKEVDGNSSSEDEPGSSPAASNQPAE